LFRAIPFDMRALKEVGQFKSSKVYPLLTFDALFSSE
jgi:hypothetical protein